MNSIVFLAPNTQEPFTTSDVIAEFAGVAHHSVTRILRNHKEDFEGFGKVGFEIHALEESATKQKVKIYRLNGTTNYFAYDLFEEYRTGQSVQERACSPVRRHAL